MSKLADPTICPDCRGTLDGTGACTACGLRLTGPLAAELWQLMVRADALVERLRVIPAAAPAPLVPSTAVPPVGSSAAPTARDARRLPSASVPMVLLGLGGLCLLVSAAVFVAVTWSSLGVAGRTLVLLLVTGLVAVAASVATGRGLRWGAETLWVVVCGLLALDLHGARSAGLLALDALAPRHAAALVGLVTLLVGAGTAAWSAPRASGRLRAPQVVAGLGLLVATVALAWVGTHAVSSTAVAVAVLTGLALLLRREAPWTAYAAAAIAALSWLGLAAAGLHRLDTSVGTASWWAHLEGWPLLVAAGYVATPAALARLPEALRSTAAGAALACLSALAIGPVDGASRLVLTGCAVVAALALLARLGPQVWARAGAALAAVGGTALLLQLLAQPWPTLRLLDARGRMTLEAPLPDHVTGLAPWTAFVVGTTVLLAGYGAATVLPASPVRRAVAAVVAPAPAVAGLAAAVFVLGSGAPVWVAALALAVALAAAAAAVAWQQGDPVVELVAVVAAGAVAAPALRLALAAHLLTALMATALTILLLAGHRWLRPALLWGAGTTLLAALLVPAGALGVAGWCELDDAPTAVVAVAVACWAATAGVVARVVARDRDGRVAAEVAGLVVGLGAVALAPAEADAAVAATVVGSAVCLVAATDRHRTFAGWLGAAVLAVATALRVSAGVTAPEAYTLPAAALLLAAGAWRLHRDASVGSGRVLGSGLALALLPSLLLALDEPVSVRGVLVGVAGLLALAAGVTRRWAAPFLAGALVTGLLALRHLGPVAEALPRWVTFGAVGVALLAVGITWEARRRDLGVAARYLAALR